MGKMVGIGLLSAAVLLSQVALTRVFSIAQFYHFAFLVVSLALLGFGASGSLLALFPRLRSDRLIPWYALGFAWTTLLAYLLVNHWPFDSYSIAWDRKQAYLLVANLLELALPFVFAGALIGALLSEAAEHAGRIYGVNLLGSAAGAILAPLVIGALGSERAVLICVLLAAGSALALSSRRRVAAVAVMTLVVGGLLLVMMPDAFAIRPSPYKTLSHFRRNPDAAIVASHENAYSRLDIIESPTIHSAQGASLTYFGPLPPQVGLLIDGDNLLPVSDASRIPDGLLDALPVSVAYAIRPDANVLILGAGGGMDVHAALVNRAETVTVVEANRLIYAALTGDLAEWAGLADNPKVTLRHQEIRAFAQQAGSRYDLVQLSLTDNYRPLSSGAFSLTENYTLTVEAVRAYLDLTGDDGLLVVNRWLQEPPSESLRVLALIVEALDSAEPLRQIVVFRSFQVATFIVKPIPFTEAETTALLAAIGDHRFDLVLAPQMPAEMINRYANVGEAPIYHQTFLELATAPDRDAFYAAYPFEVSPPTDDQPFFFHFFRWGQMPDVLENLGARWQPFGGSGFFVLVALLAFAVLAALVFIIIPVALRRRFRLALRDAGGGRSARTLAYFTVIGLAFLFVEIAFIQQYILILGTPTLALATVIGALLLFSGVGSLFSDHLPWRYCLLGLAALILIYQPLVGVVTPSLLALPLLLRVVITALLIGPVAFLMGVPFPKGINALQNAADLIPWAWAVNGSASVISAVLAILLALSWGFTVALLAGGGLYLLAAALAPTPSGTIDPPPAV